MLNEANSSSQALVAIDGRLLSGQRAGKGRYVLGILQGLREFLPMSRIIIYSEVAAKDLPFQLPASWQIVPATLSLAGSIWLSRDAKKRGAKVLLAPTNFSVPVFSAVPVVTVVYDLAVFNCPEHRPSWRVWLPEKILLKRALRKSVRVVAISEFTKSELVASFPIAPEKIDVALCAVDSAFHKFDRIGKDNEKLIETKKKYDLPDRFMLFVGTLEPRKNLVNLCRAVASLPPELIKECPLIIVGKLGWQTGPILENLATLEATGRARRLDYVADFDLPALYNLAVAAIYPSIYEGFGLPALEAMACGTPLVTSNSSSLPEVVGEAALKVNPRSTNEIAKGIQAVLSDPNLARELANAGRLRVSQFTWVNTARAISTSLERGIQ